LFCGVADGPLSTAPWDDATPPRPAVRCWVSRMRSGHRRLPCAPRPAIASGDVLVGGHDEGPRRSPRGRWRGFAGASTCSVTVARSRRGGSCGLENLRHRAARSLHPPRHRYRWGTIGGCKVDGAIGSHFDPPPVWVVGHTQGHGSAVRESATGGSARDGGVASDRRAQAVRDGRQAGDGASGRAGRDPRAGALGSRLGCLPGMRGILDPKPFLADPNRVE
jgi:hypothetical protein